MKELYKPVFWCGFALSLSALYASSENARTPTTAAAPRKPVLMQISFGHSESRTSTPQPAPAPSDELNPVELGQTTSPPPQVEDPFANPEVKPVSHSAPATTPTSAFLQAAQQALSNEE